jgi:phenylacetate-CoA ligase
MGYASALDSLAEFAESREIDDLSFTAIRSSAETLWPQQRRRIERVFGSPVHNFYGSREVNNLAAECPEHGRLHLISAWRYVEIVDEEGRPVPDGQRGHVAVTDLSNFAMPFVRYRNDDVARFSPEPCPCGRPSPVLEELLGRSSDLIQTPQGDVIHGEFFTHLFYGRDDIRQFQVRQTALDRLVVRYVPCRNTADEFMSRVKQKICRRMGEGASVAVESCEQIPTPPSGKHRFTISDVACQRRV